MESESRVMRSKFLQGNNKLEEVFYNNRTGFEAAIESDAQIIFRDLVQMTCINNLLFIDKEK